MSITPDLDRQVPEPPPHVVTRDRLHARLDAALAGPITMVQAPVGYGKTVLLVTWLGARPELARRCTWLGLRRGQGGDQMRQLLRQLREPGDEISLVVVDDLDLVQDPALADELVEVVLAHPHLQLVTMSRSTPSIRHGLLASQGRLSVIDDADLAFTAQDYADLLQLRGYTASATEVQQGLERTHGWPGALRLLSDHQVQHLGGHRLDLVLGSYLESEVLSRLAQADRELLCAASALPQVDAPSAAALTQRTDALDQLSRLHRSGVPICWPEPQHAVVNPLLREALLGRLRINDPIGSRALNRRAVDWLRTTGRPLEAIQQLLGDGDLDTAVKLLGEEFLHHLYSDRDTISGLLAQIPEGEYWQTTMMHGLDYLADGNDADARAILHSVEAEIATARNPITPVEQTALAAFRLRMSRQTNYAIAIEVDLDGLNTLPAPRRSESVRLARALSGSLHCEYGLWLFHHYEFVAARSVLTEALTLARFAGLDWLAGLVLAALSCVHATLGHYAEGRRLAAEAELACRDAGPAAAWLLQMAHMGNTLGALDAGDAVTARQGLERIRSGPLHRPDEVAYVGYLEASLLLLEDRPLDGLSVVLSVRQAHTTTPMTAFQQTVLAGAAFHCLCQLERLADAETELELIKRVAPPQHQAMIAVYEARLLLRRDDPEASVARLQPYLDQGADTGLTHGLAVLTTYTAAAEKAGLEAEAEEGRHRTQALTDRLGIDGYQSRQSLLVARLANHDPGLSPAELNVLHHLGSDAPLSLVAEELFVSANTLKTHLRKIYRKLQVTGRDQAVERARLIGLI